jgi:periplasmic protein TonB
MTVKDSVSTLEPKSGAAKPVRRDAVGAEIPVTVHASRTTQGLSKNLPAVHEDTKTVIVLQQGAVVRLTAVLTTGETVVLTNRMTGGDVLCRVGNVKSQPGIQHYVDLEFIQRAPGFWGDTVAASSAPVAGQTPTGGPVPLAPPMPIAAPVAALPTPLAAAAPPPAPVAVAAPRVPVAVTRPSPGPVAPPPSPRPAPAPVVDLPAASVAATLQPAPLAEPIAVSWDASQTSSVAPIHSGMSRSTFGSIGAHGAGGNPSGSHKDRMAVAAAVVLALGGVAGGYWFYGRQITAAGPPAVQEATNVPTAPATPDPTSVSTVFDTAPDTLNATSPEPPAEPEPDIVVESRPVNEASLARVQPPPSIDPTPHIRRKVPIEQLKAPKAKATSTRLNSNQPPPAMMGTLNLGEVGAANSLLVSESAGPAPPPVNVSQPAIGGQLQPPQMISSAAATYPSNARMQRVQGVVVLDALIDETGKVAETTVVTGPPLLVSSAQESVRNWKYKPARLNGKPIAVHTRVSVRFSLQ